MDFLDMLMGSMASPESLSALEKQTGASQEQAQKLLASSLPLLVGSMTKNAQSKEGARNLKEALNAHTNRSTTARQIGEADVEDGEKIVRHIFGNDTQKVVQTLSSQTNMDEKQVTRGLASIAPALLSMLYAASKVDFSDGLDFSELMTIFGGTQQSAVNGIGLLGSLLGLGGSQSNAGGGLLGGLLGAPQQQQSGGLLGSLLGVPQQQQQSGGLLGSLLGVPQQQQQSGGLLGSLLGGTQQQNTGNLLGSLLGGGQQQNNSLGGLLGSMFGGTGNSQPSVSTFNGGDLLNILAALMK
ncbi:MAG: DUF937 domain-containing protein [Blautia sp.]|nr:DUF937 domain-containing protein [Blautia sp.]MBR2561861.1 DUF937 domain-containing protein [Eubacterium sp.]